MRKTTTVTSANVKSETSAISENEIARIKAEAKAEALAEARKEAEELREKQRLARIETIKQSNRTRKEKGIALAEEGCSPEEVNEVRNPLQECNVALRKGVYAKDFPKFSEDPKTRKKQFTEYLRKYGASEQQIAKEEPHNKQWAEGIESSGIAYRLGLQDGKSEKQS